jgi:hypothetical protein
MRKGDVVAKFSALSQYLPGGTKENHRHLSQDSRSLGRHLNTFCYTHLYNITDCMRTAHNTSTVG